jgi:tetratricopeptide (TPR) repeat protein
MILPKPRTEPARETPFPPGTRLSALRALRRRLQAKGRLQEALPAAREIVRRDPGLESLVHLGAILGQAGRHREALETLRLALRQPSGPAYLVTQAHVLIAQGWYQLGRHKRAGEALKRAWATRPKPKSQFGLHLVGGHLAMARSRYPEAVGEYRAAERTAVRTAQRQQALGGQAMALILDRRISEALDPARRALRMAIKRGDPLRTCISRGVLAWAHGEEGQHARALRSFQVAMAEARAAGSVSREGEMAAMAAVEADRLGRWESAEALFRRSLGLAEIVGREQNIVAANAFFARDEIRKGNLAEAERYLERARRRQRDRNDWVARLHVFRAEHAAALAKGEPREALKIVRNAERLANRAKDLARVAEFRRKRGEIEAQLGRPKAGALAAKRAKELEGLKLGPTAGERRVRRRVEKLAKAKLPVLIVGEAGSGTRELARILHRGGPLVEVACEQVAHEQTELYGWEAGAWSGAETAGNGYAQLAEGGLLVLAGLDRVPKERQKHFVDLVEGRVRRVGSTETRAGGYRVAALCEDPGRLIPALKARLGGAVVVAEREGAFPARVERWLGPGRRMTADALLALHRHAWDGGEAELRGLVERLKVTAAGKVIGRRDVLRALDLGRRSVPAGR